jgi:hypothetical protein
MTRCTLLALLAAAVGCSDGGYRVAPVSGRVTIDGRPAAGIHVEFLPDGGGKVLNPGPGSIGIANAQGVYVLNCVQTREKGAVVGRHRVLIRVRDGADEDEVLLATGKITRSKVRPKQLPARYNAESELRFDVPPRGTDQANFDLSSK